MPCRFLQKNERRMGKQLAPARCARAARGRASRKGPSSDAEPRNLAFHRPRAVVVDRGRRDARRPSHRVNHYSYRSFLRECSLSIARDAYLSALLRWHPPSVAPRRIGRSTERPRRHRAFDGSIHASSATTSTSSFVSRARSRDDSIAPLSDVRLFLASGVGVGEFSPASPVAPVADPRRPRAASEKLSTESVDARLLVRRTRASPRRRVAS